MRALLRNADDQTRIAFEVEEAVYDQDEQIIYLYSASGTSYAVSRIVKANADSMIEMLAATDYCDMTDFEAREDE